MILNCIFKKHCFRPQAAAFITNNLFAEYFCFQDVNVSGALNQLLVGRKYTSKLPSDVDHNYKSIWTEATST